MAADLHIHIFEDIDEKDMEIFFCTTVGSKWSPTTKVMKSIPPDISKDKYYESETFRKLFDEATVKTDKLDKRWSETCSKMSKTPNIWIGEVSWLKAALFDDNERYIPDPVSAVNNIIGEDLPVIDDELVSKIVTALGLENKTSYAVTEPIEVKQFLEKHKGKRVFAISW
jgi:hypothetical protein